LNGFVKNKSNNKIITMALNKKISGAIAINEVTSNWKVFIIILRLMPGVISDQLFVLDDMASVFKVFMMIAAMVAMVYSRHYLLQHTLFRGEYFVLVMLSILGMMVRLPLIP
jgi:NADH:ubiquinone oxidoreductase subunit 2 (subunit N)